MLIACAVRDLAVPMKSGKRGVIESEVKTEPLSWTGSASHNILGIHYFWSEAGM